MLKYLFVFLILFLQNNIIYTQIPDTLGNKNELFNLTFSIGPAFPFGDISNKEVNNSSGYAQMGINLNVDFGFDLDHSFGIVAKGIYVHLGTNIDKLNTALETQYQLVFGDILNAGRWDIRGLLTGISYKNKISNRIYIENRLSAGFMNFQPREIKIHFHNFFGVGGPANVKYTENGSTKVAYNYSVFLAYSLSKRFSAEFGLDYYYSHPVFDMVNTVDNLVSVTEYKYSFSRNVNLLNLTLNLRYHFF